ncbi:hypothetical protein F2P45_33755 [Massilia sp. CCM 8733]|uniref:Uncharacterized protein n=1 Tax=Massilia mucilaginosa TaxID=2609282 RepID=A0ABX0P3J6_9BURK|nr:hypothetical protein [Massilia mucilaginosa]NHZ93924.1 hypothetical protein [Massilia mucilaginosa]
MDTSALLVLMVGVLASSYGFGAVWLRLNDTFRELPSWVPLAWPVLLPVAFFWLVVSRFFGRTV